MFYDQLMAVFGRGRGVPGSAGAPMVWLSLPTTTAPCIMKGQYLTPGIYGGLQPPPSCWAVFTSREIVWGLNLLHLCRGHTLTPRVQQYDPWACRPGLRPELVLKGLREEEKSPYPSPIRRTVYIQRRNVCIHFGLVFFEGEGRGCLASLSSVLGWYMLSCRGELTLSTHEQQSTL